MNTTRRSSGSSKGKSKRQWMERKEGKKGKKADVEEDEEMQTEAVPAEDADASKAPVQVTADDLADEEFGPVKEKGKKGKKGKAAPENVDEGTVCDQLLSTWLIVH